MDTQKTQKSQNNFEKVKRLTLPSSKTYHKAIDQDRWYWLKDKLRDLWNRIESSEITLTFMAN